MISDILQNTNVATVVPISLLMFLTLIFLSNKSKRQKKQTYQDLDDYINSFNPQPLIDSMKINSNEILELLTPLETNTNCLNLAKINHFNFLNDKDLRKEAEKCIRIYGVGACGPRGFYGTIDVHLQLENRLAEFMGMEECVVYSYAFSTISSAIGAYCKKSDIIFCDEHISFCAVQGMLAAKSKIVYFKHNDMEDLEELLKKYEKQENQRKRLFRKFLLVEGIFGKTGKICPLPELMELRKKYKLRIFIDESVSFGVLGTTGRGVSEHYNINRSDIDMIMGSLEGCLGSIGGFCVGASVIIEHQRLSGLGYCFSASLPPFLSHITLCALDIIENDIGIVKKLQDIASTVDKHIKKLKGITVISDEISPLKVITMKNKANREENVKKIYTSCTKNNVYIVSLQEYLYFNVNVNMSDVDIDKLINVLRKAIEEVLAYE